MRFSNRIAPPFRVPPDGAGEALLVLVVARVAHHVPGADLPEPLHQLVAALDRKDHVVGGVEDPDRQVLEALGGQGGEVPREAVRGEDAAGEAARRHELDARRGPVAETEEDDPLRVDVRAAGPATLLAAHPLDELDQLLARLLVEAPAALRVGGHHGEVV